MGRKVKLSPNAESTEGKFLKWFAASVVVSPFSLSSSFCLTKNERCFSEAPLGQGHIFLGISLLTGSWPCESKFCVKTCVQTTI